MPHLLKNPWEFIVETLLRAALLTPLVVVLNSTIFPFIFPKVIFFEAITGLIVVAMIPLWKRDGFGIKWNFFTIALIAYAVILFVTALNALNPNRAFWSNHERMTGVILIWHAMVFALCIASYFRSRYDRVFSYLMFGTLVSAVVGALGIYQAINPSFLMSQSDRVSGTFGNPIYLGAYSILFLIITLYLLYRSRRTSAKWVFIAVAIINIVAWYLSGTRSALLAAAAAAAVYAIFLLPALWRAGHKRKIIISVSALGVGLIALLAVVRATTIFQNTQLARFADFSFTGTASTRFIAWEIAFNGWKERPLLGWGPENYYYVFNKFFQGRSLMFGTYETWFDHAHNALLDILVTEGVVGAIGYVAFFVSIIWLCVRPRIENMNERLFAATLTAFFAAHFVNNLFVFDHPSSYVVFFAVVGVAAGRAFASEISAVESYETAKPLPYTAWQWILQLIVLAFSAFIIIPSVRQNYLDLLGQFTARYDLETSKTYFERSLATGGSHEQDVLLDIGRAAQNNIPPERIREQKLFYGFALESLDKLFQLDPNNVLALIMKGQLLTNLYAVGNRTVGDMADKTFAAAAALSQERQQIYFSWGKLKLIMDQYDSGKQILEKAVAIEPRVGMSHWYLGVFISEKEPAAAAVEIDEAQKNGLKLDTPQYQFIAATIYEKAARYEDAARLFGDLLEKNIPGLWNEENVRSAELVFIKSSRDDLRQKIRERYPAVFVKQK